jgi:hypothetical protein
MKHHEALPRSAESALYGGERTYLEGITSVSLSVDHLHHLFINRLSHLISIAPIISSSFALFFHEKVLRVIDILVRAGLDAV